MTDAVAQTSLFDAGDLDDCATLADAGNEARPEQARSGEERFGHGPSANPQHWLAKALVNGPQAEMRRFGAQQRSEEDQPSPHLVAARRLVREMRRSRQDPQLRQATVRALCGELLALLDEPVVSDAAPGSDDPAGARRSEL